MREGALTLQDAELVEEIRRGESAAEAALYEKFAARVYYLALKELRRTEDAEDVRAETLLRILQSIREGRLQSPQALASFILGTAHNVIRERIRQHHKAEQITSQEMGEMSSRDSAFFDGDLQRAIEEVIHRLKPKEQAFLRMYYYEELPKEEIARGLGIKEERVRLMKSRALKHFREVYERLAKKTDTK